MKEKVAILQSSYIPWKGYFDIINMVDLFIFLDDVQFTVRDWRCRNRIKGKDGPIWLTVPCGSNRNRLICEVDLKDASWQEKHWKTICHSYSKARYFDSHKGLFEEFYLGRTWRNLSDMNQYFIRLVCRKFLGIDTKFADSRDYKTSASKQDRILDIVMKTGYGTYLSGPSAMAYIDEDRFRRNGIEVEWMEYGGYPEYEQLFPPFLHEVSILDLIFNMGPDARRYMKSTR